MDDIVKKLMKAGIPAEMIEKLQSHLGDTFESTILSGGLKAAAKKIGMDEALIPEMDFKVDYRNAIEAVEELTGKDLDGNGKLGDGDGKSGIIEALDHAKAAIANTDLTRAKALAEKATTGLFTKAKALFGKDKSI